MCEFQQLYFNDDGYVVRCKKCNHFQIGFVSTLLTVSEIDFGLLLGLVKKKLASEAVQMNDSIKSIIIPTPYTGVKILLTKTELKRFSYILEEADNEAKAIELLSLFDQ